MGGSGGSLAGRVLGASGARHPIVLRVIAAAPLLGIGLQHLLRVEGAEIDAILAPFFESFGLRETLGAGFETFVAVNGYAATLTEIVAGALLLLGLLARPAALAAMGVMAMAFVTHLRIDWANEPPVVLPVVVFAASAYVLFASAGRWSLDRRLCAQGASSASIAG